MIHRHRRFSENWINFTDIETVLYFLNSVGKEECEIE